MGEKQKKKEKKTWNKKSEFLYKLFTSILSYR